MCLCGNVEKILEKRKKLEAEFGKFKEWPKAVKEEFYQFRENSSKSCISNMALEKRR